MTSPSKARMAPVDPPATGGSELGNKIRAEADAWARRGNLHALADQVDALEKELRETTSRADKMYERLNDLLANPRDEYHTMAELYEYRMVYNALATVWFGEMGRAVKSWRHHDGELCFGGGWFIVCLYTPDGLATNHYKAEHWDLFAATEVETAPEWDGHTPAMALERLRNMLR